MFAIEVDHPLKGWTRLQGRYHTKKVARGWFSFIRAAWHGLPLRIVEVNSEERQTSNTEPRRTTD